MAKKRTGSKGGGVARGRKELNRKCNMITRMLRQKAHNSENNPQNKRKRRGRKSKTSFADYLRTLTQYNTH